MRINARLSGSMLRITTLRDGFFPPKGTPLEESAKRARRHLRDKCDSLLVHAYRNKHLLLSGWGIRFLTLTFEPSERFDTDCESDRYNFANACLKAFFKKLKKKVRVGKKFIAYLAVPEKGALHGRLHFHVLLFAPYFKVERVSQLWHHGFIDLKYVNDVDASKINNLYAYFVKYMGKSIGEEKANCFGKKRFHSSRNIKRHVCNVKNILDSEEDIALLARHIEGACGIRKAFHWAADNGEIEIDTLSITPSIESISRATDALRSLI